MKKWIYRILLVVCIGVFAYSAYNLYLIYSTKAQQDKELEEITMDAIEEDKTQDGKKEKEEKPFVVNWDSLRAKSDEIVAWLVVPGCDVSHPIVQTTDNNFYLNHSVSKEFNELGSIFLDYENSSDFSDFNSIVYGHSVLDLGGMFTDLSKFEDASFFKKHPNIYLFTPEKNYIGHVVCFARTKDGSKFYDMSADDMDEHIEELKSQSIFSNDVEEKGNLITLSTCNLDYGLDSDERYVLVAILEPTEEPIVVK